MAWRRKARGRRSRRYRKKIRRIRQKKRNYPTTSKVRSPSVVADRTFAKLKYNEIIAFTEVSYLGSYVFSGNGMYDPNITSTGTQPTGFDQYMGLYDAYKVYGSKIRVKLSNAYSSSSAILATIPVRDYSGVASGGINEVIRDPRVRYQIVAANQQGVATVKNYQSTKKAFGLTDLSDIVFEGSASSNPSDQWYWLILGANISGAGALSLQMHVEIVYYVEFFRRKDINVST